MPNRRPPARVAAAPSPLLWALPAALVFALLVLATAATAAEAADAPPPAAVQTATATRQMLQPDIWLAGTVVSRNDAAVAAEVSGRLLAVRDVGERVQRGEVLGELDDAPAQIQLRNDDAAVAGLATRIEWLAKQEQRFQTLALSQSTAASELDRLAMERRMAEHELAAAEARRDETLYRIEKARITAPFNGVVVARHGQPGEFINQGTALLRLVDDRDLEARVTSPIGVLRHIQPGQLVPVALGEGAAPVMAPVRAVVPVGDQRTRTAEIRVSLTGTEPTSGGPWIAGEAVRAALPNGHEISAVTVPRDALVLRNGQVYLFRISGEGTAERLSVQAGDGTSGRVAVTGQINAGDQVVVRGAETLRDGQAVRVLEPSTEQVAGL